MLTVQRVYELIDALAPFDTQGDFDNSGLLVGNPQAEVTGIHLALDVTDCVIDDALAAGANLIVTHHPLPPPFLLAGFLQCHTEQAASTFQFSWGEFIQIVENTGNRVVFIKKLIRIGGFFQILLYQAGA